MFSNQLKQIGRKGKIFVVAGVITLSALSLNFTPARANGPAQIYFSSTTKTVEVNETFTLDVMVDPKTVSLDTVRSEISFPKDKLEWVSFSLGTLYPKAAPYGFVNQATGLLSKAGAVLNGQISEVGIFATVGFKALAEGSATIQLTANSHLIRSGAEQIDLGTLGSAKITILPEVTDKNPVLSLVKKVGVNVAPGQMDFTNQSAAEVSVGDVLTYRVDYSNPGGASALDIVMQDTIPANATYKFGSIVLNGIAQTDAADEDSAQLSSGKVQVRLAELAKRGSGYFRFQATITGAPQQTINNQSLATFTGGTGTAASNIVSNTIGGVVLPQCSDGIDNDADGKIDLLDPGCAKANDNDETDLIIPLKQCNDGADNDGDGQIDMADIGCSGPEDDNETDPILPNILQCSDGIDNDGDGKIDMADPGCAGPGDNDEADIEGTGEVFQCNDKVDNDGDGKMDMADPGCDNKFDNNEEDNLQTAGVYQCNDSADNDGDGKIDLADPGCDNANDDDEMEFVDKPIVAERTEEIANIIGQLTQEDVSILKVQVQESVAKVVETAKQVQKTTVKVNKTAQAPAVAVVTATSVAAVATVGATSATGASLLTYLQFLVTQPLLLFRRRQRRGWGLVYNSITKQPVDLAVIRVYLAESKRLTRTVVTDKQGRYKFILNPGKYTLTITKSGWKFPSVLLEDKEKDGDLIQPYFGEEFTVAEKDVFMRPIPVDPAQTLQSSQKILRRHLFRKVQFILTLIGPILAVVSFAITPKIWVGVLVLVQLIIYGLFRRLAHGAKPKDWGTLKDRRNKRAISSAVVRVFDTKFNKLLETQVTGRKGQYAFLVGDQEYYLTGEKAGYFPKRTPRVNLKGKGAGYLAQDMYLEPLNRALKQEALKKGLFYGLRSDQGRQKEEEVAGLKKVVRPESEKFQGAIKEVDLGQMHEDYYNLDWVETEKVESSGLVKTEASAIETPRPIVNEPPVVKPPSVESPKAEPLKIEPSVKKNSLPEVPKEVDLSGNILPAEESEKDQNNL